LRQNPSYLGYRLRFNFLEQQDRTLRQLCSEVRIEVWQPS